ncbi:MAG TPA: sigma 54-interacting transcriptional regulator, partial [Gammaproteobacteria bacterium]|nr:sigma 54-interacting transcriptional regulator [Gammaproteobacteria bacterium]
MSKNIPLLLVDDDPGLLRLLSIRLKTAGYDVETASDGQEALDRLDSYTPSAVITDLRMDGMDGLALLKELAQRRPGLPVLLITAHGTIPDAVAATQAGAFGFLTKPVDKSELLKLLERALDTNATPMAENWRDDFVTTNARMEDILSEARMIGESDAALLITGASGTGKELLARAVHAASPRADAEFVAINCGAMPENLLESELFGHEKGSFTGATRDHPGLIAQANNGTLFLDEIGDMPLALQAKILHVLQEKTIVRLG